MGIQYIYISIGVGTLILNGILYTSTQKSNKATAYKHIPSTKKKPEPDKRKKASTFDDDDDDFTMNIDNSGDNRRIYND